MSDAIRALAGAFTCPLGHRCYCSHVSNEGGHTWAVWEPCGCESFDGEVREAPAEGEQ